MYSNLKDAITLHHQIRGAHFVGAESGMSGANWVVHEGIGLFVPAMNNMRAIEGIIPVIQRLCCACHPTLVANCSACRPTPISEGRGPTKFVGRCFTKHFEDPCTRDFVRHARSYYSDLPFEEQRAAEVACGRFALIYTATSTRIPIDPTSLRGCGVY